MKKGLLLFFVFLALSGQSQPSSKIIGLFQNDTLYLRWKGARFANLSGYKVFIDSKPKKQLVETIRLTRNEDWLALCGLQTKLVLQLAGAPAADAPFDNALFNAYISSDERYNMLGAQGVVYPKIAKGMGEVAAIKMSISSDINLSVWSYTNDDSTLLATQTLPQNELTLSEIPHDFELANTHKGVKLQWNPPSDPRFAGILVYRANNALGPYKQVNSMGNSLFAFNPKGQSQFVDYAIKEGRTYHYQLRYRDVWGRKSLPSVTKKIRVQTSSEISAPKGFKVLEVNEQVKIVWNHQEDSIRIFRATKQKGPFTVLSPSEDGIDKEYFDFSAASGTEYYYYLQTVSKYGELGLSTDTLRVIRANYLPPSYPKKPQGAIDSTGKVTLFWEPSSDASVIGYEVYRLVGRNSEEFYLRSSALITDTFYQDTLALNSANYYGYALKAMNGAYLRSKLSAVLWLRRPEKEAPPIPIFTQQQDQDSIWHYEWTASQAIDFSHFNLYQQEEGANQWDFMRSYSSNSFSFKPQKPGKWRFTISAVDSFGNESAKAQPRVARFWDEIQSPRNARISLVDNYLELRWDSIKSFDNQVVIQIVRMENNQWVLVKELLANQTSVYLDKNVDVTKEQKYRLILVDDRNKKGEPTLLSYQP